MVSPSRFILVREKKISPAGINNRLPDFQTEEKI